jgi:transposase
MPVCPLAARNARCASPDCRCRDRSARYPSDLDDSQWRVLEPEARAVMAELTRASSGYHGGKKITGRGRHVAVDAEGWLLALVVTAASVSDRAGAKLLVIRLLNVVGTLRIMWADSGYDGAPLAAWIKKAAGITLEVVKRSDPHAFQVVRRRWVVERTFGWLMRCRRLVRYYERLTAHHEAMVYRATMLIMTRRLARHQPCQLPEPRWGGDRKPPRPEHQAA